MTSPLAFPICWEPSRIEKAISLKAKLDEKQTDYFLACHSPIRQLRDVRANQDNQFLDEEQLYKRMIKSNQRDVQGVVFGDAGTGKSHLIHWLKLRADDGLRRGELKDAVTILIQRKSGSLKDALEQLIKQLVDSCGKEFARHLAPVQAAFSRISETTARQKLVQEMAIELGPRREDRQRPPLPKLLRPLGEACSAAGFGKWLCRDGGVIARRIEMLTQASSLKEREHRPIFAESDLLPEPHFRKHEVNSLQVVELINELEDDPKLREQAAGELNSSLESAVVELTGLSGANLRKVFDQIRAELASRNQRLLLFIEDVSTMAELDTEVVNALEPQDRLDLCPMTAMLGMTRVGYERLRANQKGRLQIAVAVGDDSAAHKWHDDAEELSRFAARYLNALRLPDDRIRSLSELRRQGGGDVSISACSNCRVREACHERFGKVTLHGNVDVGLFPLSPNAPHALLQRLEVDEPNEITRTPRGFLQYLLKPLIQRPEDLEQRLFPDLTQMPVRTTDPEYWTQFQQQYCGGWPDAERDRLRTLAVFWIGPVASADAAARSLTPLLEPLKFRPFSRAPKKPPTEPKPIESPVPSRGTPKPQEDTHKRLDSKKLQDLRDWLDRGTGLKFVTEWRTSLAVMIKESIRWEDRSDTPMSEVRRHLDGYKFISIADQGVESATASLSIEFPRTEETRALLEALARYQHQGGKTWNFDGGALHRRVVSRWLRHNSDDIARYFQPNISGGTIAPVQTATQLLCLASLVRRRSRLPNVNADLLQELLKDSFPESTLVLSARLRKLIDDLRLRCVDIREKLFNEVVVPQGRTGGINFIDPREIVKTAQAFRDDPRVVPLDEAYDRGLWQSRFYGLNGLSAYSDLAAVVEEERTAVGKLLADIREFLSRQGYEVSDMSTAWGECCRDLKDLVVAADKDFFVSPALRELTRSDVFATARSAEVGAMLRRAAELVGSDDIADVVAFSSGQLSELAVISNRLDQQLGAIADELSLQETHLQSAGGDPVELHRAFLSTLEAFDVVNDSAPLTDSEGATDDSDE